MKRLAFLLALVLALVAPRRARGGDRDADALLAVAESMSRMLDGAFDDALKNLDAALAACASKACEASTRAQLHVAVGVVRGTGMKDLEGARAAFERGLREDASVQLDRQFSTRDVEKAFGQAKDNVKKGVVTPPPSGRRPPTKEQLDAVAEARERLARKEWTGCMEVLVTAMSDREFAAGKLALAECEDLGGLLLEAASDADLAAKYAEEEGDTVLAKRARDLAAQIRADTPKVKVVVPRAIDDPVVMIDGVVVPKDRAAQPIPHNPGKVTIEVKGKRGSYPFSFKATESVDRGEQLGVNAEAQGTDNAVLRCIMAAKTADEAKVCIETGGRGRGLTIALGVELSGYGASDEVGVLTPAATVRAENPTAGWSAGGSFLVDVVTAASPDIVATASPRFDEVRYAATLGGDVRIGPAKVGAGGGLSIEPDYVGRSIGGQVAVDLADKSVTPAVAYRLGLDTLGRAGTPFDVFSRDLTRHGIDAGVTFVIDEATIVVGGLSLILESGDASKPYRHVPMFRSAVADRIPRGATPELVAQSRLDPAPLEQLPDGRTRFALFGRAAHRFEKATLRGDQRLYLDSWGLPASTTDTRLHFDLTETLWAGPHLRVHAQGPVDFWQRAYVGTATSAGLSLPQFRTTDKELGPMLAVTAGGSGRLGITPALSASLELEAVYTQYFDHIYVYDRWGAFTALGLELKIE